MRSRLLTGFAALVLAPAGAAAVSPTVLLTIVHVVHGCHAWQLGARELGPTARVTVKPGGRVAIRPTCPMDFDLTQTAGPPLGLGTTRIMTGTQRTIAFARRGTYAFSLVNVESSQQAGLQTLGPDNTLRLTVVVR